MDQKAFEQLKQAMADPEVLAYCDPNGEMKLIVDGSKYRLSSMLTQLDPETHKSGIIRYDSHSTAPPESRYAQIEIDSSVVELATRRNHIYLFRLSHYIVSTDHKPLLPIYNSYRAEIPPRIFKHKLQLRGYSDDLIYEPGKDNPTDYISSYPYHTLQAMTRPSEIFTSCSCM